MSRTQGLWDYLQGLTTGGCPEERVPPHLVDLSVGAFLVLRGLVGKEGTALPVPDCAPSNNGQVILLVWSKDHHYLECEVFASGELEFFYKDRSTGKVWGVDTHVGDTIPDRVINLLGVFEGG